MIFVLQKEFFTNKFKNEIIKVRKSNIEYQIVILSHTESCGAIQSHTESHSVIQSLTESSAEYRVPKTYTYSVMQSQTESSRVL